MIDNKLIAAASAAAAFAYCPYSHFPVGAAVLADWTAAVCVSGIQSATSESLLRVALPILIRPRPCAGAGPT